MAENFDDEWIKKYEKVKNELSDHFFEADNENIKIYFLYCNKNNQMNNLKAIDYKLNNVNMITKDELISIIKKHRINNNIRYNAVNILKHHVDLGFEDIPYYINNEETFLKVAKLKTIKFKPTIKMFQNLNSIFLLFNENSIKLKQNASHSNTKKIVLYNSRKTKRK